MEVKIKSFDIRKPQVSIGTKPFLTVTNIIAVSGTATALATGTTSISGVASFSEIGG